MDSPSLAVALDVDGVIANTLETLQDILREEFGLLNLELEGPHYDLTQYFPAALRKEAERLIRHAYATDYRGVYSRAYPYPQAVEVAQELERRGLLRGYVTRRPVAVSRTTYEWLDWWEFPRKEVCFAGPAGKAPWVRHLGASIIVEDSPHEAEQISADGLEVFLLRRSYNQHYSGPRVIRIHHLGEVLALLEAIPLGKE